MSGSRALGTPRWSPALGAAAIAMVMNTATASSVVPNDEHNNGGKKKPGETLQEWSSIIGIVTAIVGNVLIAMALNVQRYAHTRLHKQRIYVRRRARAALKRAKSGGPAGTYGTIGEERQSPTGETGYRNGNLDSNEAADTNESDPLTASFLSGATNDSQGDDESDDESKVASTYLKSPYWWLGQVLITLGEMGNFLAYGFAPASIVSPLGVVALISNCIIAPAMFHEQFRQRDFWGVVVAVGGVVTVVLSANTEETKLDPHAVWDAITTMEFEVYLGVTIALIILLMWASGRYGRRTILIDLGLVGLFGGYTALATKGVSSMLSSTLWRAFTTPVTYVLIVILLGTAVMQIRYVNKALQRFDSTQVIPIQFVMFTLCVILGSAVLYRDFEHTTGEQAGKFVGGCLLTFFGVFLITSGRQHPDDDEEEDLMEEAEGVEETIGLSHHDGHRVSSAQDVASTPVSRSRRSSRLSRVSFASTIKPSSPPQDAAGTLPTLKYTTSEVSESSHAPESAPLLRDPWPGSEEAASPPRGIRTVSADSVITTSTATPAGSPHPAMSSDRRLQTSSFSAERPQTARPGLGPSRNSSHQRGSTFINPSPLSSTVTTVVKDGFLRDRDDTLGKRSSLRRIRSSIRASLFLSDGDEEETRIPVGTASEDVLARTLSGPQIPPTETDDDPTRRRSRSVSDALGDFFRPKRKRKDILTDNDIEGSLPGRSSAGSGDSPDGEGQPSRR